MLKKALIAILTVTSPICSFALPPLQPYTAVYKTTYDLGFQIEVEAERTLQRNPEGQWILNFEAENWFARIQQTSTFVLEDADLKPLLYRRYQRVFGKKEEQRVIFHWDKHKVTNDIDNKPWRMDIPDDAQDLLSYQLKLRYDLMAYPEQQEFRYPVADGGKIKFFTFRVVGPEVLDTPMGRLNTVKLEGLRHSNRDVEHLVWVATDWDNLLVRVEPVRRRDREEPVVLHKASLAGKPVEGF